VGAITITGTEQSFRSSDFVPPRIIYDFGTVSITVGTYTESVNYQQGSTAATVAAALRDTFNSDAAAPVTATLSGNTLSFNAKTTGTVTNYAVSASSTTDEGDFVNPSFNGSPANNTMTGGSNGTPGTTIYDQGTVTVTVNSHSTTVPYGQGATNASVAQALATAINSDSSAAVTATVSGNVINLVGKTQTLYPVSATSPYDTGHFSAPSFTTVCSGLNLQ
jgi:phage tail sheath gpL-like